MYKTTDLFEEGHSLAYGYISSFEYPWEALKGIKDLIIEIGKTLDKSEWNEVDENVWIHKEAKVMPSAYIGSPCIIGKGTEVRHCAFIRGSALVGENCVIGNSVELKNVIISDNVQVPHYNYVGDSILGYRSHMGAGSLTSNVKSDKTLVVIKDKVTGEEIATGIKQVGAFLGDSVEVGCNSVLCPGAVIGKRTNIYPLSRVRGVVKASSIYKGEGNVVGKREEN
ncbi:MAG: UDP-N-acetylglucosamine pyrophosphorylase [Candidatus Ornithospirochaeta sp.]